MGRKEPLDDPRVTHGICQVCGQGMIPRRSDSQVTVARRAAQGKQLPKSWWGSPESGPPLSIQPLAGPGTPS